MAGALTTVALAVALLVWGTAPGARSGGALLPGLRPDFGVAYSVCLLTADLLVCAWLGRRRGAVHVLVAAAGVDALLWIAHLAGLGFPIGAAAALTAGFGTLVLWAGLLGDEEGRAHSNTVGHPASWGHHRGGNS